MDVVLNGQPHTLPDASTLRDLMRERGGDAAYVAVAVNDCVIPRSRHGEVRLQPGDRLEIVQAVGGG